MKKHIVRLVLLISIVLGCGFFLRNIQQSTGLNVKEERILKHGFRLLEEQLAVYIKEHYSGVSKIEFSPIFIQGGGFSSPFTADVLPVIYDEEGNRAVLGKVMNNVGYPSYGILSGLILNFDSEDNEIIELENSREGNGVEIDVSGKEHLPAEAKIKTALKGTDENIKALVDDGQLKNVEKNEKGSPDAEITYNIDIKRGEHWKWN